MLHVFKTWFHLKPAGYFCQKGPRFIGDYHACSVKACAEFWTAAVRQFEALTDLSDHNYPVSIHYDSHGCSTHYKAGPGILAQPLKTTSMKGDYNPVDRQGKQDYLKFFFTPWTGWPDAFKQL